MTVPSQSKISALASGGRSAGSMGDMLLREDVINDVKELPTMLITRWCE